MAAPAELEQIIRAELRQPIEQLVRQVVVELVRTSSDGRQAPATARRLLVGGSLEEVRDLAGASRMPTRTSGKKRIFRAV